MTTPPRGYAIGYLRDVELGPEIAEYIERIEGTMAPYGGRFLVHGGRLVAHEGVGEDYRAADKVRQLFPTQDVGVPR